MTSFMAPRKRVVWVLFPLRRKKIVVARKKMLWIVSDGEHTLQSIYKVKLGNYPNVVGVLKTMLGYCL